MTAAPGRDGPPARFEIDESRLYEVGPGGGAGTPRDAEPMDWLGPRHRRLLAVVAATAGLVGMLAGLSAACLMLGARHWAAAFALAMLAASPLLLLGPGLDRWRHRRRRHLVRPPGFPPAGGAG